jgi:hypothetical protein
MTLEEANNIVTIDIRFNGGGWVWMINTHQPFGNIIGYKMYPDINDAIEELKQFLRYFTKNVLKNGDTIREYVVKHKPKKDGD